LTRISGRVQARLPAQPILPERSMVPDEQANTYFAAAHELFYKNSPANAWKLFEECLRHSRTPVHFIVASVCLFQGLGRHREAMTLLTRANDLSRQQARKLGVRSGRHRILDRFWTGSIGHTATLDYVIKLSMLEGRRRDNIILFIPPEATVANRFLLEQWRPHLTLIENAADLPLSVEAVDALRFDYFAPQTDDGATVFFWELAARTHRRWYGMGRTALLSLPAGIAERGRRALRSWGIPDDAWFVALHVREAGSKPDYADLHRVLNADVMDYLPAIAEITQRGGWVIRMGDPSMV